MTVDWKEYHIFTLDYNNIPTANLGVTISYSIPIKHSYNFRQRSAIFHHSIPSSNIALRFHFGFIPESFLKAIGNVGITDKHKITLSLKNHQLKLSVFSPEFVTKVGRLEFVKLFASYCWYFAVF